jgi:hypothetical protein
MAVIIPQIESAHNFFVTVVVIPYCKLIFCCGRSQFSVAVLFKYVLVKFGLTLY